MVNQVHQSTRGMVANDLLPDELELRKLLVQATCKVPHFEDNPERYLVIAQKSAE